MQLTELKTRLANKVGHSFLYQANAVRLVDWEINGEECVLKFESKTLRIPVAGMPAMLKELLPMNSEQPTEAVATVQSQLPTMTTGVLSDVNAMLLDSMKKVAGNPGYIKQAESMAKTANAIINSTKTQVSAAALLLRANELERK